MVKKNNENENENENEISENNKKFSIKRRKIIHNKRETFDTNIVQNQNKKLIHQN